MSLHRHQRILERHGPRRVTAALEAFLTDARRARIEEVISRRIGGISLAVEAPSDPHNAAAVVRTAEAVGVLSVHVVAAEGPALHARSTTQGAFHWIQTFHHQELDELIDHCRGEGRRLAGACPGEAVTLDMLAVQQPVCVVVGNEQRGLSDHARAACDVLFSIPMHGMSESLNLSVAGALCLYELVGRRRRLLGRLGDLSASEREHLRATYYLGSVDERLVLALLPP